MTTITAEPTTNLALTPRGPSSEEIDAHFRVSLEFVERAGYKPTLGDRHLILLLCAPARTAPDVVASRLQARSLVALKASDDRHPAWNELVDHLYPLS